MSKKIKKPVSSVKEELVTIPGKISYEEKIEKFRTTSDDLLNRYEEIKERLPVAEEKLESIDKKYSDLDKKTNMMLILLVTGFIVLLIMVATLVIGWYKFQGESFNELKYSIENLREEINDDQYDRLNTRLNSIENKLAEKSPEKIKSSSGKGKYLNSS